MYKLLTNFVEKDIIFPNNKLEGIMKDLDTVVKTLSEREKLSAIFWLVVGIIQCLSCVGIICGAWNVYASVSRFKQSKAVLTPWQGIVNSYDKWMSSIITGIVINVLFGGVIGVAASIYDMVAIRGYVLENRKVFEENGL